MLFRVMEQLFVSNNRASSHGENPCAKRPGPMKAPADVAYFNSPFTPFISYNKGLILFIL